MNENRWFSFLWLVGESVLRTITIKDKKFTEDEGYPLWLVMKRIPEMDDAISVIFVMAGSHKEAVRKAEETWPKGEIMYVTSMWNLFERLEFMCERE